MNSAASAPVSTPPIPLSERSRPGWSVRIIWAMAITFGEGEEGRALTLEAEP